MLPQRELLSTNIPLRTLSIPTTSNMTESVTVIETTEAAGWTKINVDNIIAIAPRPICVARIELVDFTLVNITEFLSGKLSSNLVL